MAAAAGWATSPSAEVQPEARAGRALGMAAGLGTASLRRAGPVACTCAWVLGPHGAAARGTRRFCPAPWSSPRTTLSGCVPSGCCSEQAAEGAGTVLPVGTSLSPVNCGRPEADFNSVVHGNDWWVGSVVRYSCRPGFLLLGDPASACQSDGRWTPKPTCLREYHWVSHSARGGALPAWGAGGRDAGTSLIPLFPPPTAGGL